MFLRAKGKPDTPIPNYTPVVPQPVPSALPIITPKTVEMPFVGSSNVSYTTPLETANNFSVSKPSVAPPFIEPPLLFKKVAFLPQILNNPLPVQANSFVPTTVYAGVNEPLFVPIASNAGGGAASNWWQYPAQGPILADGFGLTEVSTIGFSNATDPFYLNSSNVPFIGSNPLLANWSVYPALGNVNVNDFTLFNTHNIRFIDNDGITTNSPDLYVSSSLLLYEVTPSFPRVVLTSPLTNNVQASGCNIINVGAFSTNTVQIQSGIIDLRDTINGSNATLEVSGDNLYFNGTLIATESNTSNVGDWSLFPVSNPLGVNFNDYDASNMKSLYVSTISVSSMVVNEITVNDLLNADAIGANSLVVNNVIESSTITVSTVTAKTVYIVSQDNNTSNGYLTVNQGGSNLYFNGALIGTNSNTSNISQWSFYPVKNSNGIVADTAVAFLGLGSNDKGVLVNGSIVDINSVGDINLSNDSGASILDPSLISLYTANGEYGKISLVAESGFGDEIGGLIELKAFSGTNLLTGFSRVNLDAATITITGGAVTPPAYIPEAVNITNTVGAGIEVLATVGPVNVASGTATTVTGGLGIFLNGGVTNGTSIADGTELYVNKIEPNGSNTVSMRQITASTITGTVNGPGTIINMDGDLNMLFGYGIKSDFPLNISTTSVIFDNAVTAQKTLFVNQGVTALGYSFANGVGFSQPTTNNVVLTNGLGSNISLTTSTINAQFIANVQTLNVNNVSSGAILVSSINGAPYAPGGGTGSAYTVFVAADGSDITGNGSQSLPYATLAQALTSISAIATTIPVVINIGPGTFAGATLTRSNTFIVGAGQTLSQSTTINTALVFNITTSAAASITAGLCGVILTNSFSSSTTGVSLPSFYFMRNVTVVAASAVIGMTLSQASSTGVCSFDIQTTNITALGARGISTFSTNVTLTNCNLTTANTPNLIFTGGTATLIMSGCRLTSTNAASTALALVSINNANTNTIPYNFINCQLVFTSSTADTGTVLKTCVQFNSAVAVSATISNCLFQCVGSTRGAPLNQCISNTTAGSVALTYGDIQAVSPAVWIDPTITRTVLFSAQQGVNAVGGGAGDYLVWDGNQWVAGSTTVSIGRGAGNPADVTCVNIGNGAGTTANTNGVAIGNGAGASTTTANTVAIGVGAGVASGLNSICIGQSSQSGGANNIMIGAIAGNGSGAGTTNCIILNATNTNVSPNLSGTVKIAPVRNASLTPASFTASTAGTLNYNSASIGSGSFEVSYNNTSYKCSLLTSPGTITLSPILLGSTYIVTGTGTLTFITTSLTVGDAGFFLYLKNGTNPATDITLGGVSGATTLHQPSGSQNGQIVVLLWNGTVLTAY